MLRPRGRNRYITAHISIFPRRLRGTQHAPKEVEEPKRLDNHTNEWPFEEDEDDSAKEAERSANFLSAPEEGEGLLGTDDEREAGDEENLSMREPERSS